jgi:hypothetical protein
MSDSIEEQRRQGALKQAGKTSYTIPTGELWEIAGPFSFALVIGGEMMGHLSQKAGTMKLRGTQAGTTIKSQEEVTWTVQETAEDYRVRKLPPNRDRDRR